MSPRDHNADHPMITIGLERYDDEILGIKVAYLLCSDAPFSHGISIVCYDFDGHQIGHIAIKISDALSLVSLLDLAYITVDQLVCEPFCPDAHYSK